MIDSVEQAVEIQARRQKAVRRWFKREYGRAVEAHDRFPEVKVPFGHGTIEVNLRDALDGDFTGCRNYNETHGI